VIWWLIGGYVVGVPVLGLLIGKAIYLADRRARRG
jgi:hypothetical protein